MTEYADIIIFAFISLALFLRLFWILGQKNGRAGEDFTVIKIKNPDKSINSDAHEIEVNGSTSPEIQMKVFEPDFSKKSFIKFAESKFKEVLSSYVEGNNLKLSEIMTINVLRNFSYSMSVLEDRKYNYDIQILKMHEPDVQKIEIKGLRKAEITVHFYGEIIRHLTDIKGKTISGHESKVEKLDQIWIFTKDLTFSKSSWILDSIEGDNILYFS